MRSGRLGVIRTCEPASGNFIFIADITAVELASAFTRRVKGGSLTQAELQEALARFDADIINELLILEIGANLLAEARRLVEIYALRAYDAVQLAIAVDFNRDQLVVGLSPITLVSADEELLVAAQFEDLFVENPNNHP